MITYKEALGYYKMTHCYDCSSDHGDERCRTSECFHVHEKIVEALGKQIPKVPEGDGIYSPYYCPSCGEELSEHLGDGYYKHHYEWSYCHNENCLQRITWKK